MRARRRRGGLAVWSAAAVLAAGCGGTAPTGERSSVESRPDQIVRTFHMDTYADGALSWRLSAPEARIYEADHRADITGPEVLFYQRGRPGSMVTAAEGRLKTDTRDMWAGGGVVIRSTEGARLETPWMRYDSREDRLLSTAAVVITRGASVVTGVGWSARSDFSELEVLRQRGEIAPEDEAFFRTRR